MSARQRVTMLALAGAIAVIAVVLILVINPGSGTDNPKGGPATVTVKDAKPVGGVQQLKWKKGQTIDLTISSDTADEVHFHGYDVHKDVAKGGTVNFRFPATIEGKFIVELEAHKQTLAEVEVTP